jgi:hypothetical protein
MPCRVGIDVDSASDSCFAQVKTWITDCCSSHETCPPESGLPLPTRVLDVGFADKKNIRLLTSKGLQKPWIALSHCWGNSVPVVATKDTIGTLEQGIAFSDLPLSFQDAVTITRRLGHQYLWIDSLCIIQDSLEDWAHESGLMGYVYRNAFLTISTSSSPSSTHGIFRTANQGRGRHMAKVFCQAPKAARGEEVYFRSIMYPNRSREFHLRDRAWVLQESLLSPRVLSYCSNQIFWSCRTARISERDPATVTANDPSFYKQYYSETFPSSDIKRFLFSKSPPIASSNVFSVKFRAPSLETLSEDETRQLIDYWYLIVEQYIPRSLTYSTDRLPAISGIAKTIAAATNYTYIAGLWREDLLRSLCWQIGIGRTRARRPSQYIAPSWSWASIEPGSGEFYMQFIKTSRKLEQADESEIIDVEVKSDSVDEDPYLQVKSGILRVRGLCCSLDDIEQNTKIRRLIEDVKECMDEGPCSVEGRGIVLLCLGTTPLDYTPHWPVPDIDRVCLIIKGNGEGTQEFKRVGLCQLKEWIWKEVFWAPQTVTIV